MAATFSVAQQYGSGAGSVSLLGATGSLWNFKQATSPGTSDYNTAGSNVPAGQNSFGCHFRPYFSTNATNTFSNIRFYQSTTWSSTTYGGVGKGTNGYTQATNSSTAIASGGASSVAVPTASATDSAITLGTLTLGSASGYGPSYLRVQLTTGATAPAGDKQRCVPFKFREFGETLLWETIPSKALLLKSVCRDYVRNTFKKCEDIVRTIWRQIEIGRNIQSFVYTKVTI